MYIICLHIHNWFLLIGCLRVVHPLSKRVQPPISNSLNKSVSGALHLVKFLSCTLTDFKEWLLAQNNIACSWHVHIGLRWLFIRKIMLSQKSTSHQDQCACRNPGLNQGPLDLQSNALPTELFRLEGRASPT